MSPAHITLVPTDAALVVHLLRGAAVDWKEQRVEAVKNREYARVVNLEDHIASCERLAANIAEQVDA